MSSMDWLLMAAAELSDLIVSLLLLFAFHCCQNFFHFDTFFTVLLLLLLLLLMMTMKMFILFAVLSDFFFFLLRWFLFVSWHFTSISIIIIIIEVVFWCITNSNWQCSGESSFHVGPMSDKCEVEPTTVGGWGRRCWLTSLITVVRILIVVFNCRRGCCRHFVQWRLKTRWKQRIVSIIVVWNCITATRTGRRLFNLFNEDDDSPA